MAKVLVAYYSRTGNTKSLADAVANGARSVKGAEVVCAPVDDIEAADLMTYHGIILGSPVYYGTMAWEVKKLLDESVEFQGKMSGKVGGAFATSANPAGGNETTILDIVHAMLIHGMIVRGTPTGDHYGPVAINAPDERSLRQGEHFGRILAELAVRMHG